MEMIKICKVCGKENDAENFNCDDCFSDISSVKAISKNNINESQENEELENNKEIHNLTRRVSTCTLFVGNESLNIINDCTIGREAHGKEILGQFMTVSRQHVEISFIDECWKVKDLNTTNGTYINNRRLSPNLYSPLQNGDELSLSSQLKIRVEIV